MCFVLAFLDVFALASGFAVVSMLRIQNGYQEGGAAVQLSMLAPTFLIVSLLGGAYSPKIVIEPWANIGRALRAMTIAAAATILIAFFLKIGFKWSRVTYVFCVSLSGTFVFILRYLAAKNAAFLVGGQPYEVLRLHDGPGGVIPEMDSGLFTLLSREDFDPASLSPAGYDYFAKIIEHADRVIVHCPIERRQYWAQALKGADVLGEIVTPEAAELNPLGCGFFEGNPTLIVSREALKLRDRILKRAIDLTIASCTLIVLFPLLLLVALVIRLDGGPAFFRQTRVGRSNRQFTIYKFRSMHVSGTDEPGTRSASPGDERITRIGRFMRMTSIDELPQLINVLRGEMSIVGPRPHALGSTAENLLFWDIDDRYWHRHTMRPGLTGLAQVRGYRGPTISKQDLLNRLQSDLEYMRSWSIWADFVIMIRTFNVLLHANAF